jgi:hypothetical protein
MTALVASSLRTTAASSPTAWRLQRVSVSCRKRRECETEVGSGGHVCTRDLGDVSMNMMQRRE